MKYQCWFADPQGGFWERKIDLPCFPFPGLIIGSGFKVKEVSVCQGCLDGSGGIEVEITPGHLDAAILVRQGWCYQEVE